MKPGYKQTEVGVIPEEWDSVPAGSIGRFRGGNGFPLDWQGESAGDYPFFKVSDMNNEGNQTFMVNSNNWISEETRKRLGATAFPAGSIVFAKVGAAVFLERKKILSRPSCLDNNMAGYALDERRVDIRFIHTQLLSKKFGSLVATTALPALNGKQLGEMVLALPPLPEQRAISGALSDVDALLGALERLIGKKRDLKQAAMQQLLTGKTRLPGFHGEWEVKTFGHLFDFSGGYSASRDQLSSEGHCYLHYGDIHGATKTTVDVRADNQSIPKLDIPLRRVASKSLLEDGDVVFVDASEDDEGTSRHVVVVNKDKKPFISGLHTIVAKSKTDELAHDYRRYCFQTAAIRQQFLYYAVGTKVSGISKTNITKLKIPIPRVLEQTAIAEVLMQMDAELAALEQRQEKTRALKQAIMQELLTGKIRLVPPLPGETEKPNHNWQINEAVIIGALALQFGTAAWPLPRKRRVKLTYLLHRHAEGKAEGYLKKAAGPYNPKTKYQGPEGIALKNAYVREHNNGRYEGLIAGGKIAQAEQYFAEWYPGGKEWVEQFRFSKTDDLEVLATVDMAIEDLKSSNRTVSLKEVKEVIRAHPEWEAKLSRSAFSDANIAEAMSKCNELFMSSTPDI